MAKSMRHEFSLSEQEKMMVDGTSVDDYDGEHVVMSFGGMGVAGMRDSGSYRQSETSTVFFGVRECSFDRSRLGVFRMTTMDLRDTYHD